MDQDRHAQRAVPGAGEEVGEPASSGAAETPPPLRLAPLQASLGRPGRWRSFWGEVALGLPALMALMSALPHKRAPLPGESFHPGDLEFGWWSLLKTVVLLGVPAGLLLWSIASRWRGGGLRNEDATIEVNDDTLLVAFGDHSVPIDLERIDNVYRDGEPVVEIASVNPPVSGRRVELPAPRTVADYPPDAPLVVELRDGGQLMVRGDAEQLAGLQRALTPDPERRVARFEIGGVMSASPLSKLITWAAFLWLYAFSLAGLAGLGEALVSGVMPKTALIVVSLVSFAGVAALWSQLRRRRLEVGMDGLRIDGLWRRRFVRHDDVTEVDAITYPGRVRLKRRRGLALHIAAPKGHRRLAASIEAARDARAQVEAEQLEGLERGERDLASWRRDMEALRDDKSYRKRAVRIDQLEELLKDPTASPERRVGAALAVRSDDAQRKRIELAAAASADEDLRQALEAAAEGEIAEAALTKAQKRFESH